MEEAKEENGGRKQLWKEQIINLWKNIIADAYQERNLENKLPYAFILRILSLKGWYMIQCQIVTLAEYIQVLDILHLKKRKPQSYLDALFQYLKGCPVEQPLEFFRGLLNKR